MTQLKGASIIEGSVSESKLDTSLKNKISNLVDNQVFIEGDADNSAVLEGEYTVGGTKYKNKAISQISVAMGAASTAGLKGWYYSKIEFGTNPVITLSDKQPTVVFGALVGGDWSSGTPNIAVGDKVSIVNNAKYDYCGEVKSVSGNKITLKSALPFESLDIGLISKNNPDDWSIYLPDKESAGIIDLGGGALAEGINTKATNIGAHAEGIQSHAYGQYSHAEGRETKSGYAAHAEGYQTKAVGHSSHAEGNQTESSGKDSHAEGKETVASGIQSHAEGQWTTAKGSQAHAEGESTVAMGNQSHAEGYQTQSYGLNSHAEGNNTIAYGSNSHAEGFSAISLSEIDALEGDTYEDKWDTLDSTQKFNMAFGNQSHVEGNGNIAIGKRAHVEGIFNKGVGDNSHAEGESTQAIGKDSHAEGYQTTAKGTYTHAEGNNTIAYGSNSHAEGFSAISLSEIDALEGDTYEDKWDTAENSSKFNIAIGNQSHVEGNGNIAVGKRAHVEGIFNKGGGDNSHAEGESTQALGKDSHSEGFQTAAKGISSHSQNSQSEANGNGSFALGGYITDDLSTLHKGGVANGHASIAGGIGTTSNGIASIALGSGTTSDGNYSLSIGYNCSTDVSAAASFSGGHSCNAVGSRSFAFGFSCKANKNQSVALGGYTITNNSFEFACGKYNQSTEGKTLFSVGIGSGEGTRNNALEVTTDGKMYLGAATESNRVLTSSEVSNLISDASSSTDLSPYIIPSDSGLVIQHQGDISLESNTTKLTINGDGCKLTSGSKILLSTEEAQYQGVGYTSAIKVHSPIVFDNIVAFNDDRSNTTAETKWIGNELRQVVASANTCKDSISIGEVTMTTSDSWSVPSYVKTVFLPGYAATGDHTLVLVLPEPSTIVSGHTIRFFYDPRTGATHFKYALSTSIDGNNSSSIKYYLKKFNISGTLIQYDNEIVTYPCDQVVTNSLNEQLHYNTIITPTSAPFNNYFSLIWSGTSWLWCN